MNITRTNYRINTIKPDGSQISIAADYTNPSSYDRAAIGEVKEFESLYTLQAGQTFVGKTIFITGGTLNIGNSYPAGTPTSGYRFSVTGATANSTVYSVPYLGCSNNGAQNEMFKATISFTNLGTASAMTATIKVQQILGFDINNYRACDFYDNQTRLLKSLPADASNLLSSANTNSFYNNSQKIWSSVLHITEGSDYYRDEIQVPFQACWYNKGRLDAVPYFSVPTVALEVNGIAATGLSPIKSTKVTLTNSCPVQPDYLLVTIIDVTNNDQTVTWWANYDYSAAEILTVGGAGAISGYNSKFLSPSQLPTLTGGSTYESFFDIDHTQLTPGNKYRIIWTLYNLDPYYMVDDEVNSFISDEFTADFYEPFNGEEFDLIGKFSDYQKIFLGNDLEVVPEERIKAILDLNYWDGSNNSLSDRLTERFVVQATATPGDIRSSLKEVNITLSWEETIAGQLYKHIVDEVKILRTGVNTYLMPNGTEFIATGVDSTFQAFEQACRIAYTFRVRYESDILNIRSYIDGVLQTAPLATQNWIGKTILIDWALLFEYELLSPIIQDTVNFPHQIRPKDYENSRDEADRNLDFLSIDDEVQVLCEDDTFCPVSTKINLVDEYRHIVNLDRQSFKVQNIEEEETWLGELPQLVTDKLTDVDSDYVADEAGFCVDLSLLNLNQSYKVAAIAKKLKDPPCIQLIFEIESPQTASLRLMIQLLSGSLTIDWGEGTITTVNAAAGVQTFIGPHSAIGAYDIFVCGNCENISHFVANTNMDSSLTSHQWILYADLTRLESDLAVLNNLQINSSRIVDTDIWMPVTSQNINFLRFFGYDSASSIAPFNVVTTFLTFTNLSGNIGTFTVQQMRALNSVTFNAATIIENSFTLENTAMNQVFDFGTKIFAQTIVYRNTQIAGALTSGNLDLNIDNVYTNRVAYSAIKPGAKTFTANGNNAAPGGTLVAPTGYIQADGVTGGNDGTPANAKEQIYVLINQNTDFTTTKKYNWTFNVN